MSPFSLKNFLTLICFYISPGFLCQDSYAFAIPDSIPSYAQEKTKYFRTRDIIIPSTFLVYGCLKPVIPGIEQLDNQIMDNIQTKHPDFHTRADDYLQWVPSASIYMLDAMKVKTKHNFLEHLAIDAGSILITGGAGFIMRKISGNMDVYNSDDTQFPSGHTANAFRGAEIVYQELRFSHPVMRYSGYLVASAVGIFRIYNKSHYLTEVLAGAGLGMLSTKLTYILFDKLKAHKKRKSFASSIPSR